MSSVALVLVVLAIIFAIVAIAAFVIATMNSKKQAQPGQPVQQAQQPAAPIQPAQQPAQQPATVTPIAQASPAAVAPPVAEAPAPPAAEAPPTDAGKPSSFAPPASAKPAPAAASTPPDVPSEPVQSEIDDHTRVAPRPKKAKASPWKLVESEGDGTIAINDVVVVGRSPSTSDHPGATAVSLDDPGRSISKTHAVLRVEDGQLTIEDLESTNGVHLVGDDGETAVEPGSKAPLEDGAKVLIGEREFTVERTG